MNADENRETLRVLRRGLTLVRLVRGAVFLAALAAVGWAVAQPGNSGRHVLALTALVLLLLWTWFVVRAVRLNREIQTGGMLMAIGRLDDAEACLARAMRRFSLSLRARLLLCQQFAALLFRREKYQEVVAVCREVLRHRLAGAHGLVVNTRLLLADSLLLLNEVSAAYAAMRPVYDLPLTLADRMKLLPVQLRYELAADHAASAAGGLPEKVRIAELLDSPRAALVHALLAEACRRQSMPAQQRFLSTRARLYHDLAPLAVRYPVIAPIAAESGENVSG